NLALVERLLAGRPPHSRPVDFAGLLLAGLPLSGGALLGALLAAPLLSRLIRRADPQRERAALLVAALASCAVFVPLAWTPSRAVVITALLISGLTGAGACCILRAARDDRQPAGAWRRSRDILLVPLIAGFVAATGVALLRGDRHAALLSGLQCLVAVGLYLPGFFPGRPLRIAAALAWIPPLAAIACGLLACIGSSRYGAPGRSAGRPVADARPNVVLVVLDTVRADRLKRYGYTRDTMPALERWADGAFVFRRAVSTAGWTAPAHASLFSGLVVSRHGVHYADGGGEASPFSSEAVAGISWLPARLSEAGYHGVAVTANELAIPEGMPGFARVLVPSRASWSRLTLGSLADRLFPPTGRLSERLRWRLPHVDAEGIIDVAMRALPSDTGPVFFFLNVLDAHSPYNPPREALELLDLNPGHLFSRYEQHRQLTLRWPSLPAGKQENLGDLYDGELRWIDRHIDRFFRFIDARLGPNTVVVITSDHGEELGEEGRVGHEFGLAQRLIHVPLFVKGPGLPSGETDALVSLRGIFHFIDGIGAGAAPDLNRLLETDEFGILSERYPSGHNRRVLGPDYARPWVSVIEGELKGVGPSSAEWTLLDVSASGFGREVPVTDGSRGEELRARIDSFWERYQDRRAQSDGALSEEELRRLRSLGYVK
ncbi:MAG TPA: sulfatase, partial [Candidatus Polarisedimenticolia bacterium]|nr:sulfatase [Candidatus Polarisedimenticolia bacterium]